MGQADRHQQIWISRLKGRPENIPKVVVGSYEVKAGPDSEAAKMGAIGAFVHCFHYGKTKRAAAALMRKTLKEDGYAILEEEFVAYLSEMEYESENEKGLFEDYGFLATADDDVVYSEFYSYSDED